MKKASYRFPAFLISAAGLIVLGVMFVRWWTGSNYSVVARISATASIALFAGVCLRFVPGWMKFWIVPEKPKQFSQSDTPRFMDLKIFITLTLISAAILVLVHLIRVVRGYQVGFIEGLEFWRCLDSNSYLQISTDWYASEGDRSVQLVFFPGYPLLVRLATYLTGYELYAGLLVSILCFSGVGCMFYRLMRLDHSHKFAIRALKYLCIFPGTFFYAAPMTESLFLLLCISCIYLARTGKWTLGCLLGCYAAFTRSLGATLLAPMVLELVHARGSKAQIRRRIAALLLIPLGLAAYLWINYAVSGDPFKFQQYQSEHWGHQKHLISWFFNSAAYQLENMISAFTDKPTTAIGLWLANLLSCFASLLLMLGGAKRLRPSYTAWFIGSFFMAVGATWLISAPRYMLTLFPISISMAIITHKTESDQLLTCCTIALNLLYLYAFVARWQVW